MGLGHSPQIVKNGLVLCLDAANKKSFPAAGSIYFDGSGDYMTVPSNSAFGFGTGNFTIEYWWYPTRNTGIEIMVDTRPSNIAGPFVVLGKNSDGSVLCYDGTLRTGGNMTLNAWNHVAWCRNGTSNVVYLNGVSVISFTNGFDADSTRGLTIGANASPVFENCQGYITDLRITKGIARYTSNFTPPQIIDHSTDLYKTNTSLLLKATAGIKDYSDNNFPITVVGNTTVSTQTNVTTWTDLSAKGNNGTLVNGPTFNSSNLGSFVFDGINDYTTLSSLQIAPGTGAFTWNFWIKLNDVSNLSIIFSGTGSNSNYGVLFANSAGFGLGYYANGFRITHSPTLGSSWRYITFMGDGGANGSRNLKLYINTVQAGNTYTFDYNFASTTPIIGANHSSFSELMRGNISNVSYYNRALTESEILQNFNALRGRYGI